jgi:hypothetical protein
MTVDEVYAAYAWAFDRARAGETVNVSFAGDKEVTAAAALGVGDARSGAARPRAEVLEIIEALLGVALQPPPSPGPARDLRPVLDRNALEDLASGAPGALSALERRRG